MDGRAFGKFGTLGFICRSKSIRTVPNERPETSPVLQISSSIDALEPTRLYHDRGRHTSRLHRMLPGVSVDAQQALPVPMICHARTKPVPRGRILRMWTSFESSSFSRYARNTWILASSLVVSYREPASPPETLLYLNALISPHPCHLLLHGLGLGFK
jgi:hypothetical protein